jgi:hypothetical protein
MKKLTIIFLSIAILLVSSCEKTVYFDVETVENKLILNSILQPDSTNIAIIALSLDPLAVGFESVRVTDATLQISKNGEIAGTFTHDIDGIYSISGATLSASPNDVFDIIVSAPGRETITASTTIPSSVEIEDIAIIDTVLINISYSALDGDGNPIIIDSLIPYYAIKFTFTDPVGENFYSLKINYKDAYSQSFACFTTFDPTFTVNNDFNFGNENEDGSTTLCDEVLFSDVTFDGQQKSMVVNIYALETAFFEDPRFEFNLNHLSESLYQYRTTSQIQENNGDNPFSEPVIVYSNITNGFGIFAGFSISRAIVNL